MSSDDPLIGQTIDGRYLVRRFVGKGGMGAVYEADHVGLGKRVAIKFLPHGGDADALARFKREARAASKVSHEHVVHVFDVGSASGHEYFAMEFVEGKELRRVLDEEGALEPARAVAIARQLLAGLGAIHAAGLVHRDIKPANVLLAKREDGGDFVKIMDFGISKTVEMGDDTITSVGRVVGTPQYMSPEQIAGGAVDHRADIYAAGIVVFAMLAGNAPFTGTALTKVAARHLVERPPLLTTLKPDVPAAVAAAVARALEKEPDDRFASARDFSDALDGKVVAPARSGMKTVSERPRAAIALAPTVVTTSRGRRIWLAAAAVAIAVAAAAAIVLRHDDAPQAPAASSPPSPSPSPSPSPPPQPQPQPTPRPPPSPPPHPASRPAQTCLCVPTDTRHGWSSLCHKVDPRCRCQRADSVILCPDWDPCSAEPCWSLAGKSYTCRDSIYTTLHLRGKPGASCTGAARPTDPSETGSLYCTYCGDDDSVVYRGHDNDACSGYSSNSGELQDGVLTRCHD